MISPDYCQLLARYNRWQNENLYDQADQLDDAARKQDRGAFFASIHGTLSHLLWGDMMWMVRFDGWTPLTTPPSESATMLPDWQDLKQRRLDTDQKISTWAAGLTQGDIDGDLTWYSGILKADVSKPRWALITHLFNHQTHHRGQVHAMLTAAGRKPGPTDLGFMPDDAGR